MRLRLSQSARRAFTLVELLVGVGALILIVFVLFRVFDQTQRALRTNVAQVDVMEGGRSLLELLGRELEQVVSVDSSSNSVSLYLGLSAVPTALDLPGSEPGTARANEVYELMFLTPVRQEGVNRLWEASLYRLLSLDNLTPDNVLNPTWATNVATEGVGWLGRRSLMLDLAGSGLKGPLLTNAWVAATNLLARDPAAMARYGRVIDGVVHFRIVPLDSLGLPLNRFAISSNAYPGVVERWNGFLPPPPSGPDIRDYYFTGSVLPAALQVELGILELQMVARWQALPTRQSRAEFLNEQSARIHYFQQRIPLRNAPRLLPNLP